MPQQNLFSPAHSDEWECHISAYEKPSTLIVSAYRHGRYKTALIFLSIKYISGPTAWKGANMILAPKADFLKVIQTLPNLDKSSIDAHWLSTYRLYRIGLPAEPESGLHIIAAYSVGIEHNDISRHIDTLGAYE